MDKHYWKNAYKDFWDAAAAKEISIKNIIESDTGCEVMIVGMGAGGSAFVKGSAEDNKLAKGDADLFVTHKECFIEVTGPNVRMDFDKPLWVRPDKLRNSYQKLMKGEGRLYVIVHVLSQPDNETAIRVVLLDQLFFDHLIHKKSFAKIHPVIRGRVETYYEIPPSA